MDLSLFSELWNESVLEAYDLEGGSLFFLARGLSLDLYKVSIFDMCVVQTNINFLLNQKACDIIVALFFKNKI